VSETLDPVPVSRSYVEMNEIVMPNDANPLGNLMGGRLMHLADIAAAIAAGRIARGPVVTASVDRIDFQSPVRVGGILVIKAAVNFSHRTSMECGVSMWAEDRASGRRYKVATAYLTFVALDENTGRPRPVPRVVPDTDVEKRRYQDAENRRQRRIQGC
jgi:acyl-CoA hydrolase